jgi:hypothetical protein
MSAAQIQDWRDRLTVAAEWRKRGLDCMADNAIEVVQREMNQELQVKRLMNEMHAAANEPVQES